MPPFWTAPAPESFLFPKAPHKVSVLPRPSQFCVQDWSRYSPVPPYARNIPLLKEMYPANSPCSFLPLREAASPPMPPLDKASLQRKRRLPVHIPPEAPNVVCGMLKARSRQNKVWWWSPPCVFSKFWFWPVYRAGRDNTGFPYPVFLRLWLSVLLPPVRLSLSLCTVLPAAPLPPSYRVLPAPPWQLLPAIHSVQLSGRHWHRPGTLAYAGQWKGPPSPMDSQGPSHILPCALRQSTIPVPDKARVLRGLETPAIPPGYPVPRRLSLPLSSAGNGAAFHFPVLFLSPVPWKAPPSPVQAIPFPPLRHPPPPHRFPGA